MQRRAPEAVLCLLGGVSGTIVEESAVASAVLLRLLVDSASDELSRCVGASSRVVAACVATPAESQPVSRHAAATASPQTPDWDCWSPGTWLRHREASGVCKTSTSDNCFSELVVLASGAL